MKALSRHAEAIRPSPTLSLNARLNERVRAGDRVLNLCVGEPDFPMPEGGRTAALNAIAAGADRYTDVAGLPELRARIQRKLHEENGLDVEPDRIVVSAGAKHALYNAFFVLCEEGDEVIVPAPYWVTYPEQVRAVGATPVIVPTDAGTEYKITAELLEAAVTARTKAVVLNSPGNPTGATYTERELAELAEVIERHDLYVVEDLIYEHFFYQDGTVPSMTAFPSLRERTVLVNGLSKACAMTGWRVGYTVASRRISALVRRIQSQSTSNVTAAAQHAALGALDDVPWRLLAGYRERRDAAHARLTAIEGIECLLPTGAFYLFPDVSRLLGGRHGAVPLATADDFCDRLLETTGVGLVPGTAFGTPGHVRITYATDPAVVAEGLDRLAAFAREISPAAARTAS
ncbi:pyridoxal phosphate-dependent aminotransferase [Streptomyces sp. NRRL S-350]|uniref:pyridoxal phosphate-dependent aminotransferase n=1 Tax=Streptomyces sp. NRRL S-350 TaxID=1463902 RepID=UPI0004BF2577|nr:pyridoxal phosphate-dependent aminotransferase [Streptomyces sp. NRRL S-350]